MSRPLDIRPGTPFPVEAVRLSFARSGGPGGQNVNKVETNVVARLDLAALGLPAPDLARVRARLAARLDADGALIVTASRTRSRARNVDEAMARMRDLLAESLRRPRPRRPTRPTQGSRRRRLEEKGRHAEKKRLRRPPGD